MNKTRITLKNTEKIKINRASKKNETFWITGTNK